MREAVLLEFVKLRRWLGLPPDLDDGTVAACGRLLLRQQINVLRIEERQKSLENIFLELTGEEAQP